MAETATHLTDGMFSPPPEAELVDKSISSSAKRKREDINEAAVRVNGLLDSIVQSTQKNAAYITQQITDLLEVLKSHDTTPSILNRRLPARSLSTEPNAKRQKADESLTTSIITRASSGSYASLAEVLSDIRISSETIIEELKLPSGAARNLYTPIPRETTDIASQVTLFKKKAEDLLEREKLFEERTADEKTNTITDGSNPFSNGATKAITQITTGSNKLVLTLYGNAPGAKQLFSSPQETVKSSDGRTAITQPLREFGLPNGISTTQIVPIQSTGLAEENKKVLTMGELFALSNTVLPFQPPKPSKNATTRASNVGWYQPAALENARTHNSQSYYGQSITTGQWLDYSGTSSDLKRKHPGRSLSLSGLKTSPEAESSEQDSSKVDALFRGAYSSFAPSRDDAAAIVSQGLINKVWWQRVGEKSFTKLVSNFENLEPITNVNVVANDKSTFASDDGEEEIEQFRKLVDEWDSIDPSLVDAEEPKSIEEKEVEEVLQQISELLETLNSYQRIRNLSLAPVRLAGLPGPDPASTASKPTEVETATYNTLKSQLTLMVATLPPYAVAKLNSDQLSELNISTKIQVFTDNFKGVMEEDEFATRAKVAAMTSAANQRPPPTNVHRSSSSSLYGNQYASPRPAAPASQYYQNSQTPIRAPSTTLQRPPQTVPAPYGGPRPIPNPAYRPPQQTYPTPTYPHQVPRQSQQQYGTNQQYFQTPSTPSYAATHTQAYGGIPQSAPQGARYQPPTQHYQQASRPQGPQNGIDYRYSNGSSVIRQPSPQKAQAYNAQSNIPQATNRGYVAPSPALIPDSRRFYQAQMANGTPSMSSQPQPATPAPVQANFGATGYHTVMTPAEQSNMMERQRAQLAQQQGTQHQARNAAQAALGGSPNPQINGGNAAVATAGL